MSDTIFMTETNVGSEPRSAREHAMSTARPRRSLLLALGLATGTLALNACDAGPTNPDPEVLFRTNGGDTGDTTTTAGPEEPTGGPTATNPSGGEPGGSESESEGGSESQGEDGGESEGSGSAYGNCGWNAHDALYACNGTPGQTDPSGVYPIACPETLPTDGTCGDLSEVGCCTPTGENYYCISEFDQLIRRECY